MRNTGRLVSQKQLLQEVWGPSYGTETNYLRVYMAQLRRKLEVDLASSALHHGAGDGIPVREVVLAGRGTQRVGMQEGQRGRALVGARVQPTSVLPGTLSV